MRFDTLTREEVIGLMKEQAHLSIDSYAYMCMCALYETCICSFLFTHYRLKQGAHTKLHWLSQGWSMRSLQHALQDQITNAIEVLLLVKRIQTGGGVVHFQDGVLATLINHCKQEHMHM